MQHSPSVLTEYLPWQAAQWQQLGELHRDKTLPHALLIGGTQGVGKSQFALALACYVLCAEPSNGHVCGQCRACLLNRAGTHPDIKQLQPEEVGKRLKIDQVRELVEFLTQTSQQGGYRVAIIKPADSMNHNAANALLKSLEEPGSNTLLLLVTDAPNRLLPTVRSRCQRIDFSVPDNTQALAWLEREGTVESSHAQQLLNEAGGMPLAALAFMSSGALEQRQNMTKTYLAMLEKNGSPIALAEQWLEYDSVEILTWLQGRVTSLIKHCVGNTSIEKPWLAIAKRVNIWRLYAFSDRLLVLRHQLLSGANPNKQLTLETILLESCDIFTTMQRS